MLAYTGSVLPQNDQLQNYKTRTQNTLKGSCVTFNIKEWQKSDLLH